MKPRLFLHAGIHKTGTSAIQEFCFLNRLALIQRGLRYPSYGRFLYPQIAHHDFAQAMVNASKALKLEDLQTIAEQWLADAVENGNTTLISAESMCSYMDTHAPGEWLDQRREYLSILIKTLAGFEVTPVLCLRRQDIFIRSKFQEKTMSMGYAACTRFEDAREHGRKDSLRYYENLQLFEEAFGNIRILLYEDLCSKGSLFLSFFEALGFDATGLETPGVVRESLTIPQTRTMEFLNSVANRSPRPKGFYEQIVPWLKGEEVSAILKETYPSGDFSLWESDSVRRAFLDSFEEENEKICRRYFPGRERLFPPLEAEELSHAPPLPEIAKARLVLAALNEPALAL